VPPYLPWHGNWWQSTDSFEILGGFGCFSRRFGELPAWGMVALLIAVFPANIYMATNPTTRVRHPKDGTGTFMARHTIIRSTGLQPRERLYEPQEQPGPARTSSSYPGRNPPTSGHARRQPRCTRRDMPPEPSFGILGSPHETEYRAR
jgi:hypothetical protein